MSALLKDNISAFSADLFPRASATRRTRRSLHDGQRFSENRAFSKKIH
jgi:hypothetical protein